MKTLTVQSEVGNDGKLRLEIPCDLPPGPVEVVVVINPMPAAAHADAKVPERSARSGIFVGKRHRALTRGTPSNEMDALWKAKLAGLEP